MARRNLEVVVTVRDAASQPLDKINKKVRDTGDAAKKANLDFTQFNKTLFTTTAFVASFVKGFNALRTSLDQGAELDRLSNQYERVLGPKGKLFQALDSVTTTTIDKTIALQEGLKLANLGIVKDQEQLAEILGKAGTAAKMAGMDSGEGVKRFSDFLASGSVGQLEFLGLISRTNPALQAQMAILSKAGGVMGGVISTQAKLALGMNLLNAATKNQLHQTRDLVDIMALARTNFSYMRSELGRFLGTALGPVIEKLSLFMFQLATTIDNIRRNSKELVFLAKAVVLTTGAIIGLTGALGTLRLMVKLLSFAGIGLPGLAGALTTLSVAFLGITQPVDGLIKKLELFGGFVKGVWELITNLDPETGLSKMSKSTYNMLKNAGLLELAQTVGRIGSIIKTVAVDIYKAVKWSFKQVDDLFGNTFNKLFTYLGTFTTTWTTWWTTDSISGVQKTIRALGGIGLVLGGIFAAWGTGKLFGGLLSKIPIIGKLFGGIGKGKGGGPTGAPSDPIYTVSAGLGGKGIGGIFEQIGGIFNKNLLLNVMTILTSSFGQLVAMLGPAMATAISIGGVALAGAAGYAVGTAINSALDTYTQGKTSEGFQGSIIEQGLFKASKFFGTDSATNFVKAEQGVETAGSPEAIAAHRKKMGWNNMNGYTATQTNKTSAIVVPNKAEDEMSKIDSLGETMRGLTGAQLEQQRSAVEGAFSSTSLGGAQVTAEEMFNIMNPGISYLKQIADNTGKKEQNMSIPGPRR